MTTITEIAPPTEGKRITVNGQELELWGVTARGWAKLARRFPDLKRQLASLEVKPEDMALTGMESTPAVIALGLTPGWSRMSEADLLDIEDAVDRLPVRVQAELFAAVMEASFPPDPTKAAPLAAETPKSEQTPVSETEASTTSP